jgi:hypothetical protein
MSKRAVQPAYLGPVGHRHITAIITRQKHRRFTSQTPKSLNRSNPNLATTILKISKNNGIFGLFGLLFIIYEVLEIF